MGDRELRHLSDSAFEEVVAVRRQNRMAAIDSMPKELRACVHDYGLQVVNAIMQSGVTKPKAIRHIVETVLNEFSPTRGSFSSQGTRAIGDRPMAEREQAR